MPRGPAWATSTPPTMFEPATARPLPQVIRISVDIPAPDAPPAPAFARQAREDEHGKPHPAHQSPQQVGKVIQSQSWRREAAQRSPDRTKSVEATIAGGRLSYLPGEAGRRVTVRPRVVSGVQFGSAQAAELGNCMVLHACKSL